MLYGLDVPQQSQTFFTKFAALSQCTSIMVNNVNDLNRQSLHFYRPLMDDFTMHEVMWSFEYNDQYDHNRRVISASLPIFIM